MGFWLHQYAIADTTKGVIDYENAGDGENFK
jgi:hypothetical protein